MKFIKFSALTLFIISISLGVYLSLNTFDILSTKQGENISKPVLNIQKTLKDGFNTNVPDSSVPTAISNDDGNKPRPTNSLTPTPTKPNSNVTKVDPARLLVSKKVSLGRFQPDDLVDYRDIRVSARITHDLTAMVNAAYIDGVDLQAVSGYRSYEDQIKTFNEWVDKEIQNNPSLTRMQAEELANVYSARPGHSEHQLGTVIDVLSSENNYQFSITPDLKYVKWIETNCKKYNFYISFPAGNAEYKYEPWHLRWYPKN